MSKTGDASMFDGSEVGFIENLANSADTSDAPDGDLAVELGVTAAEEVADSVTEQRFVEEQPEEQAASEELGPDKDIEEDQETEEDSTDTEEITQVGGRAGKRIQQLIKKNKELEQRVEQEYIQRQQQAQAIYRQQEQRHAAQLAEIQRVAELQARQLELLQGKQQKEEEDELPFVEKFRRETIRQAKEEALKEARADLEAIKADVQKERAAREALILEQQKRQRVNRFSLETDHAVDTVLFAGAPAPTPKVRSEVRDMLLSYIAATNTPVLQAAKIFKNYLKISGGSASEISRAIQNKAVSKIPQVKGGRRGVSGSARPSTERILSAGYDSTIDWIEAGMPPIPDDK